MKTTIAVTIGLTVAALLVAGCSKESQDTSAREVTGADVKEEMKEAASATGEYLAEGKDQFVAGVQKQLAEMDAEIEALAKKSETYTDQAKVEAQQALATLREKRDVVAKRLVQLQAAGKDAWQEVKAGFSAAMDDLEQAYEDAKARFN